MGVPTALSFDLLMWDTDGESFIGVEFDPKKPKHGLLRHNGGTVGHVRIAAPKGARDYAVSAAGSSIQVTAPVFGNPAGHMAFSFVAEEAGDYVVTYSFNGGNSARMFVTVTD